ncbi:DNA-binding pseudobarrel domain-containing protein [Tanacetum coccineum]
MAPSNAPSFFKVLVDPSAPNLPLPPDFVTMHFKNNIPNDPIIQSLNGEHAWGVKIKKVGEVYCFDHGWNNVVKDVALGYGDFIVFWLVDACTFKMLAYSPNGCEKDLPPKVKVEDDGEGLVQGDNHMFKTIINKSHEDRLRLPEEFVGLGKIEGEGPIMMKDLDGKEWPMVARLDKSYQAERYYLVKGWRGFMRSNGLKEGDECVFKFITSELKICLAKVTRKKRLPIQPCQDGSCADVKSEDECLDAANRPHGMPHQEDARVIYF